MDAPGSDSPPPERDSARAACSPCSRAPVLDEARSLLPDDATGRWRGEACGVGEGTRRKLQELAREIGAGDL